MSGLLQNCLPQVFLQHYPTVGTEALPRGPCPKKTARALIVRGHADVMQYTAQGPFQEDSVKTLLLNQEDESLLYINGNTLDLSGGVYVSINIFL